MNATDRIVHFVLAEESALPAYMRRRATLMLLDTLAVALAGFGEPGPAKLLGALQPDSEASGVSIPWSRARWRPEDACLIFGMCAHVLDYDDVCMVSICHPSAVVLTALYVLSQQVDTSGRQFLDAFAAGTEVLVRSGEAMGFRHYELGFHATATLGALGAAAACSRLLRLPPGQTANAIALAASMSGGIQKNFGSMIKSLHVGLAAANGLRAARFAQAGVDGAEDPLEGHGWLHAFSGGLVQNWPESVALGQPFALDRPGFEQKRYPCCYLMHKIIEGTLALQREYGLSLSEFERAEVTTPPGGMSALIHPYPTTGLAAKFSGPYAVAGALADGRISLASFDDAAVLRAEVQQALRRINVREADTTAVLRGIDVGSAPVTVALFYAGGRRYTRTITASPGSPEDPLTESDLLLKWTECVRRGLPTMPQRQTQDMFRAGLDFDSLASASDWLRQLAVTG